jgi:hypothetical protein
VKPPNGSSADRACLVLAADRSRLISHNGDADDSPRWVRYTSRGPRFRAVELVEAVAMRHVKLIMRIIVAGPT